MLLYKTGDVTLAPANVILHGANCFNIMGAGVARYIKKRFPEAFQADRQAHLEVLSNRELLGDCSLATLKDGTFFVANLYTQYKLGANFEHKALVSALDSCVVKLNKLDTFKRIENPIFAMPYIGCGIGGATWNTVRPIIEDFVNKYNYEVHVYSYEPTVWNKVA